MMQEPQSLDVLRTYLLGVPVLADTVDEEYLKAVRGVTIDLEMRGLRKRIQEKFIAGVKEQGGLYRIVHFRDLTAKCSFEGCEIVVNGGYYEFSNPRTNKNVMIPSAIAHNLLYHSMVAYEELCTNLGNSPMGTIWQYLDAPSLVSVLKDCSCPDSGRQELEVLVEDIAEARRISQGVTRKADTTIYEWPANETEQAMGIPSYFALMQAMVAWGAEDIHIKANTPPMGVVKGDVQPHPDWVGRDLTPEHSKYYAYGLMDEGQQRQFEETKEMDLSYLVPGLARFRCNIYWSQGLVGMVLRVIGTSIRPPEVLGVPPVLKKVVFERMGLVLVTGQTGSGKTTTLAALLDYCNMVRRIHILTLENPIEYVYESKRALFTQRAIEIDSLSFPMAMRAALREKPDIILIGEMRDPDTINSGLKAAETGHLVVSTLHTNDAVQTIARMVNAFPPHEQETVRLQLSVCIRACVAQRLVPRLDKPGRVCAIEIMLVTPNARGMNTRDYISRNELNELYKVIATSGYDGMMSMNAALFEHYRNGVISGDDALGFSDNPEELIRWMRQSSGIGGGTR
jgi:twitching motility protein PilT